ncbi:MAG TPA: hypothetical protein EYO58_10920 [Flavobacteriales bacterium]|nr:hypothetical protein [Flavobacteriales bacterium]
MLTAFNDIEPKIVSFFIAQDVLLDRTQLDYDDLIAKSCNPEKACFLSIFRDAQHNYAPAKLHKPPIQPESILPMPWQQQAHCLCERPPMREFGTSVQEFTGHKIPEYPVVHVMNSSTFIQTIIQVIMFLPIIMRVIISLKYLCRNVKDKPQKVNTQQPPKAPKVKSGATLPLHPDVKV